MLLLLALPATVAAAAAPAPPPVAIGGLTLVPQAPRGAACLDGSAPGYWMETGSGAGKSGWIIHAEGGGWCWNESECAGRAKTHLGTSKVWTNTTKCYGSCDGILSSDPAINPDFYTFNHIFVGYCDGSSFSGQREGLHQGLMYRGRANLDAVIDSVSSHAIPSAS